MAGCKSDSRLSCIDDVVLMQSDTTVGFASQNKEKLLHVKQRDKTKSFIMVCDSFFELKKHTRISTSQANFIRRAKKTTFIIKNKAYRVAKHKLNSQILRDMRWHYSTSANRANEAFDREFCESVADIIIEDSTSLHELPPSRLIKLNNTKRVRLR